MNVQDPSVLPLSNTATADPNDKVVGIDFSQGFPNVLSQLNLPRIPVDEGPLTTGGLIALAAIVVGTLLAALAGGKAGTHYHRKVDRIGL